MAGLFLCMFASSIQGSHLRRGDTYSGSEIHLSNLVGVPQNKVGQEQAKFCDFFSKDALG